MILKDSDMMALSQKKMHTPPTTKKNMFLKIKNLYPNLKKNDILKL